MSEVLANRLFGAHVSVAGGLEQSLHAAERLAINAIQIHPSAPQRWNRKPFNEGVEALFLAKQHTLQTAGAAVGGVFFHAIYLINLVTPNHDNYKSSEESLHYYLNLAERMRARGVVVHVGSLKDEADEELGFRRAAAALDRIIEATPGASRILLEVAAGSGRVVGAKLEDLARIVDLVGKKERVGFALDTQHLWASGYDLQENLEAVVADIDRVFGADKVGVIHLNDSKTELGSRKDRHENLGHGLIGLEVLGRFINHPKLRHIPVILETPGLKSLESAGVEVEQLRALLCCQR